MSITYHININKKSKSEFLQIIQSFKSLGIVESIETNKDLVGEGEHINENILLSILAYSKKESESYSMETVKKQIGKTETYSPTFLLKK